MMRPSLRQILLDQVTATGAGTVGQDVQGYRHLELELAGGNTSAMTVKIQGSQSDQRPDFGSARSETNKWDYIQCKDLNDGSTINGDVGVVFSANDVRLLEVNTNVLRWINAEVTSYTSGRVTVTLLAINDN